MPNIPTFMNLRISNMKDYVHGYKPKETTRLYDQANSLDSILHRDSIWEDGSLILEAGCGVGAQTRLIAPRNTKSKFISIDNSQQSLAEAEVLIDSLNIENVRFEQEDIYQLPFGDNHFDHVFVCFFESDFLNKFPG